MQGVLFIRYYLRIFCRFFRSIFPEIRFFLTPRRKEKVREVLWGQQAGEKNRSTVPISGRVTPSLCPTMIGPFPSFQFFFSFIAYRNAKKYL